MFNKDVKVPLQEAELVGTSSSNKHDLEKGKGRKYRTGKLASSVTSQCLYHDVFTIYLHHFFPNDLNFL